MDENTDNNQPMEYKLNSGALILGCLGCFLALALQDHFIHIAVSKPLGHTPLLGIAGHNLASILCYCFGYTALLLPILCCFSCIAIIHSNYYNKTIPIKNRQLLGTGLLAISSMGLCENYVPSQIPNIFLSGGFIGFNLSNTLLYYCNETGALIILFSWVLLGINLLSNAPLNYCVSLTAACYRWMCNHTKQGLAQLQHLYSHANTKLDLHKIHRELPVISGVKSKRSRKGQKQQSLFIHPSPAVGSTVQTMSPREEPTIIGTSKHPITSTAPSGSPIIGSAATTANTASSKPSIASEESVPENKNPPLELLHQQLQNQDIREDPARIAMLCRALEEKLAEYGVQCTVEQALPGPVVTRYELSLAAGTKASKVSSLGRDLARSLSVHSVRVIEVIPGKTYIGIEIPNHQRKMVGLHEVFNSEEFLNTNARLPMALGVDISGKSCVVDLAKMPHLLVAGTTGSGKSVGLNSLLLSLLYKLDSEQLRLILIDPKMLELAIYADIPHLLAPVVTDMKDASCALHWCVSEMERRYRLMAKAGVRNIKSYNEKIAATGHNLDTEQTDPTIEAEERLPYIVVIVDEFADMMMMVGKKVEQQIARLAQKARAAGIHLILATQRPSVDVITGLIKANIPTRISFQVSSKIDSRTIIDQQGAESLLGSGDMLYLTPGTITPLRCHGAFVSDGAVQKVVKHLRSQGAPEYIDSITEYTEEESTPGSTLTNNEGSMYDQAVAIVISTQRASISGVQRRLRIGYNRAANLLEKMEEEGVVSKMDASGQRSVLVKDNSQVE